jgi:hypothetical protein
MSNLEAWAKLLLTYGPFALLLLFVFVIETRARSFMKETTDKRAGQVVLLLTWTAIFLLGVVIVAVWVKLNVPGAEVAIKGRLTGLEPNHRLASPYDGLYLRRVYEGNSYTAFAWRIITSETIKDGSVVPLVLDRTVADDAGVHDETVQFELPVSADFYRREVELTYSRRDQLQRSAAVGSDMREEPERQARWPSRVANTGQRRIHVSGRDFEQRQRQRVRRPRLFGNARQDDRHRESQTSRQLLEVLSGCATRGPDLSAVAAQTKLPAEVPFTSDSPLRMRVTLEEANPFNGYVVVRVCSSI